MWISGDRSPEEFFDYFQEMPWLALPLQARDRLYRSLSDLFQVKGIPHLVFLEAKTGRLLVSDGREKVLRDPKGLQFPWVSPSSLLLSKSRSLLKTLLRPFIHPFQTIQTLKSLPSPSALLKKLTQPLLRPFRALLPR